MATTVDKAQWDLALDSARLALDAAVTNHQKKQLRLAAAQLDFEQAAAAVMDAEQTLTTLKQAMRLMFGGIGG